MAFIVFEGGEGTGKSTQMRLLGEWLGSKNVQCVRTREPGGTPLAEEVRALFKAVPAHGDIPTPQTELLLVMAARAQHVRKNIEPSLNSGSWVLCDRFLDSSYVYQGIRAGVAKSDIDTVAEIALGKVFPDLTLVLHVSRDEARKRVTSRGNAAADRLDSENEAVHDVISEGFLRLLREQTPWFRGKVPLRVFVDASGTVAEIQDRVRLIVSQNFGISL